MGRSAVMKSSTFAEVDWDPRIHYERMRIQADEMYRKYRWQVAKGGPYENWFLYKNALKAHSIAELAKADYKAYKTYAEAMLRSWESSVGYYAPIEEIELPFLSMIMQAHLQNQDDENTVEGMRVMLELQAKITSRSFEVNYLFEHFIGEIDPDQPKTAKDNKDLKAPDYKKPDIKLSMIYKPLMTPEQRANHFAMKAREKQYEEDVKSGKISSIRF